MKQLDDVHIKTRSNAGVGKSAYDLNRFKAYDLTTWRYVKCIGSDRTVIVLLQTLDIDPNTDNIHFLPDRPGAYVYDHNEPKSGDYIDMIGSVENLEIDLPLDDEKKQLLLEKIRQLFEMSLEELYLNNFKTESAIIKKALNRIAISANSLGKKTTNKYPLTLVSCFIIIYSKALKLRIFCKFLKKQFLTCYSTLSRSSTV